MTAVLNDGIVAGIEGVLNGPAARCAHAYLAVYRTPPASANTKEG